MTKVIHLIRHGQGFHNVAGEQNYLNYKSYDFEDAHLTQTGWKQTAALNRHLRATPEVQVELVVVSPLTRTLETASGVFGVLTPDGQDVPSIQLGAEELQADNLPAPPPHSPPQNGTPPPLLMRPLAANPERTRETPAHPGVLMHGVPPMVALEPAREHYGVHPCDKRRPISEQKEQFPGVDFSEVTSDEDPLWTSEGRESEDSARVRVHQLLRWVMARRERHVAIVAHAGILRELMEELEGDAGSQNARACMDAFQVTLENCGLRSFVVSNFKEGPLVDANDGLTFEGGMDAVAGLG